MERCATPETIQKCHAQSVLGFFEKFYDDQLQNSSKQLEPLVQDIANIGDTEPWTTDEWIPDHNHQFHILDVQKWEGEFCPISEDSDNLLVDTSHDELPNRMFVFAFPGTHTMPTATFVFLNHL